MRADRAHLTWTLRGGVFAPDRVAAALADCGEPWIHRWDPQGLSVVVLGDELRLVLHTWPEHGLATLDILAPPRRARAVATRLRERLGWERVERAEQVPEAGDVEEEGGTPPTSGGQR